MRRPLAYTHVAVTVAVGLVASLVTASIAVLVIAIGLATAHGIAESPPARRLRARQASRTERRRWRDNHEARLEQANASTKGFVELADILDRVAADHESLAADLVPLLDRYAEIALARTACRRALDHGEPARLEVELAISRACRPQHATVLERRIAHGRAIAERLRHLDESLAEHAELVRYHAESAILTSRSAARGCYLSHSSSGVTRRSGTGVAVCSRSWRRCFDSADGVDEWSSSSSDNLGTRDGIASLSPSRDTASHVSSASSASSGTGG